MCNLDIDSIFTDITNEEPIQVCLNVLIKNDQIVHVSKKTFAATTKKCANKNLS